jgi:predicted dehydrogenase
MNKRVLIVGCGEIGSRHLQAVATLPEVGEIEVVDSRPEALDLGRKRVAEVSEKQPHIAFRWFAKLDAASKRGDLCIVATQAEGRARLVAEISRKLGYTRFLIEKIVAQSVSEYDELIKTRDEHKLSIWVNCKTRAHPSHVRVKQNLDPAESFVLTVVGGNHGLANNGVHMADLFAFYDDAKVIHPGIHHIDPILHHTKRGTLDLSGTVQAHTDKGSSLMLTFAAQHTAPVLFSVCSARYRAVVDDSIHWMAESTADTNWKWKEVDVEANLAISHMTRTFASDILEHGKCQLPTLIDCYPAHRFLLNELQPHFDKLIGAPRDHCPVT